jgi:hypothetical protein
MQPFERGDRLNRVMAGKSYIYGPREREGALSMKTNRQYDRSITSRPIAIRTVRGWFPQGSMPAQRWRLP